MKERKYITAIIVSVFVLMAGAFYGYANIKENKTCVTSLSSDSEETEAQQENFEDKKEKNQQPEGQENVQEQSDSSGKEKISDDNIYVHVCGQVKNPGVYEFTAGARILDGIKAAGGLTKKAAADAVNQAEFLEDGTQIYIPTEKEISADQSETKQLETRQENKSNLSGISEGASSKVNLNLATKEELMTLPGIGEAKANSIITYREEHGNFKSIEDIKNITGIKDGVFHSISDYITV